MYYKFFTDKMQDSELNYTFVSTSSSLLHYLAISIYVTIIGISFELGHKKNDYQLFNMAAVCSIDIINEIFDLAPNWRRRYLLTIDSLLQIWFSIGDKGDLWPQDPDFHEKVFGKDKMKTEPVTFAEVQKEMQFIRGYYG